MLQEKLQSWLVSRIGIVPAGPGGAGGWDGGWLGAAFPINWMWESETPWCMITL